MLRCYVLVYLSRPSGFSKKFNQNGRKYFCELKNEQKNITILKVFVAGLSENES